MLIVYFFIFLHEKHIRNDEKLNIRDIFSSLNSTFRCDNFICENKSNLYVIIIKYIIIYQLWFTLIVINNIVLFLFKSNDKIATFVVYFDNIILTFIEYINSQYKVFIILLCHLKTNDTCLKLDNQKFILVLIIYECCKKKEEWINCSNFS